MTGRSDTAPLSRLIGLQCRLQWARVRTRDGRVALFIVGVVTVAVLAGLVALGGAASAVAAVRAGKGAQIALGVLLTGYLASIAVSLFLGVGLKGPFSIAALRRYPLSSRDRFIARHLTAVMDPVWFVCLALDLGVAVGFSALGVTSAWLAVPAALLLAVTNWLTARVVRGAAEWVVATRVAPILIGALAVAPALIPSLLRGEFRSARALSLAVSLTPPGAAARLMAGGGRLPATIALALLVACAVGLAWAVVAFDRVPARSRAGVAVAVSWHSAYERVGGLFNPPLGPLVTKMLRYYARSPQVRWNFPFVLPMLFAGWLGLARDRQGLDVFLYALGTLAAVGFLSTGAMTLNLFGFDGAGFRRYFLLPAPAGIAVRAAVIVAILPGALLVTSALVLWVFLQPAPTGPRLLLMLAASGFGGLFLLQAASVWIAVMWPRPAEFSKAFGNRLSAAGGAALCGGMAVLFGVPVALYWAGAGTIVGHWQVWPLFAVASFAFYLFTYALAPRVFAARREQMIAVIEAARGANWLVG